MYYHKTQKRLMINHNFIKKYITHTIKYFSRFDISICKNFFIMDINKKSINVAWGKRLLINKLWLIIFISYLF
jgi:hypothetical protein